jgi:hypothetical protein
MYLSNVDSIAVLGLANSAVGCFLTAIGIVLQQSSKQHYSTLKSERHHNRYSAGTASNSGGLLSIYDDPQYVIGLGCIIFGSLSSFVCDGLLPMSALAPLTCQVIVYKLILGSILLDESISLRTWCAIALMVAGMLIRYIYIQEILHKYSFNFWFNVLYQEK